ncbi:MAG: hypothetical protein KKA32_00495 [Actinobacteria bacterium]|nr:hypothetical protein [Actinomycetota bacterium]
MKTFYTVRDIEDMAGRGEMSIQLNDDVVVTMAARERAQELGVRLLPYVQEIASRRRWKDSPEEAISLPEVRVVKPTEGPGAPAVAETIAAAVRARLGSDMSPQLVDAVVRGVLARLEEECR